MDDLYREQFMEIYKNPQNKGVLGDITVSAYENNEFCGDNLTLYLKIHDDVIEEASYDGDACAVSIASSEMVVEKIKGKKLSDAKKINKEDVLEMLGTDLTTSRIKCATLVLNALKNAIEGYEEALEVSDGVEDFEEIKIELPVTKDTNLGQLVMEYPDAAEILLDYGLHCVHCIASAFDTLETGSKLHGYNDDEVQEIVDSVNEVLKQGE